MRYQLTILLVNIILTQVLSTAHSDGNLNRNSSARSIKTSGYPDKGMNENGGRNMSESSSRTDSDGNERKNSSERSIKTSGYPDKWMNENGGRNMSESSSRTDSDGKERKNSSESEAKIVIRRCCSDQNYLMNQSKCINMSGSITDTEWIANLTAWKGIKELNLSRVEFNTSGLTCPTNAKTRRSVYPYSKQYRLVSNGSLEVMTSNGPVYYDTEHYCLNNYIDDNTPEPIINAAICKNPEPKKIIRICCSPEYLMNQKSCLNSSGSINDTALIASLNKWEGIKEFNLSGVEFNMSGLTCPANVKTRRSVYPYSKQYRLVSNGSLEVMTSKGPVYYDSDHYCLNNYKDDNTTEPIINAAICKTFLRICCREYLTSHTGCLNDSGLISTTNMTASLHKWKGLNEFKEDSEVLLAHAGPKCPVNVTKTMVYPHDKQYSLMSNGDLKIMSLKGPVYYDTEHYCLNNYKDKSTPDPIINANICNNPEPDPHNYELNASFMLVSCVFILLTVGVYLSLPILCENPGNKGLIAYLLSFFVTFLSLAILTLDKSQYKQSTCYVITFVIYFSMLSAFTWMNVICYDFWYKVRHPFIFIAMSRNKSSSSRFYWYCAYAFGAPTVLSAFLAICEYTDIPVPIKPNLEMQKCFFDGRVKQVYLYIPILILCIANIIMFVLTAVKMEAENRKVKTLNENRVHNRSEQRRFWLYTKLFTMMGINWIFEVIGSFFPDAYALWQVIDVYNLLVGPIIFVMFVCKKSTWNQLRDRYTWTKWFTSFATEVLKIQTSQSANKEDATNSTNSTNIKDVELPVINGNQNMNGTDNHM